MRGALLPLRLLLALCLSLAGLSAPGAPRPSDPALDFARAAGALCEAPGAPGAPGPSHIHAFCLACPALGAAALPPAQMPKVMRRVALAPSDPPGERHAAGASWPAYASRAPPGTVV